MFFHAMGIAEQELKAVVDSISVLQEDRSAVMGAFFQHTQQLPQMLANKQKAGIYHITTDDAEVMRLQSGTELPEFLSSLIELYRENHKTKSGVIAGEYVLRVIQVSAVNNKFSILVFPCTLALEVWVGAYDVTHFTDAEAKILLHLSIGMTLRQSAEFDKVGYETKRTHLKSILQKTRIHNQPELISSLLMQLLLYFQAELEGTQAACPKDTTYYQRYHMPDDIRLHVLADQRSNHYRVFDIGPKSGKPIMILHPMVLPHFGQEEIEVLNRLNLRTFWPLRHGALDSHADQLLFGEQVQHAIQAIEITRQTFFDDKIDLVCLISSFYYGLEYTHIYDQHVRSIFYIGACHKPNRTSTMAGRLRNGLIGLAGMNIHLMDMMVDFLGRRLQSPDALEHMLKEIYKENTADRKIIDAEYQDHKGISFRFAKSIKSIRHDFFLQMQPNWEKAEWIAAPQHFIHGTEDHIHSPKDIEELSSRLPNATFETLANCGQLIYMEHFEAALKRVANRILNP